MVYPTKTYGLSSPTLQLSSNGLSLLSPLVVRPRLDTFRLVFSKKKKKNCHFFFSHKNLSDWSKLRFVLSFPLKFQNLFFYHPMVLGGCYHNTSTLSSIIALTLLLCYSISTLSCIVLLEHY
jgi:hypothetical protein